MFGDLQDELYGSGFKLQEVQASGQKCDTVPNWAVTTLSCADVVDAARDHADVFVIKVTKPGKLPLSRWGWFPLPSAMVWIKRSDAQEAADTLLNSGGKGSIYTVVRIA
jgi:hypothetical protein